MCSQNNYIQTIIDKYKFVPTLECEVMYGDPKYLGGQPTVFAIPGKYKPFRKQFLITEEEFHQFKFQDWMNGFDVGELRIPMIVVVTNLNESMVIGDTEINYSITLSFS